MQKRLATIVLVCSTQVASVGLGTLWGLGAFRGVHWLHVWSHAGQLAVLMLGLESLHYFMFRRLRTNKPLTPWVCTALCSYAAWLMFVEAFLRQYDGGDLIRGVLLLVPFLLAMNLLVRAPWLGLAGSALFLATSLAMLTFNGFARYVAVGFFSSRTQ